MAQPLAAGHANRAPLHGHAYARSEPEKTALYQVFHRHLPGFERMWTDSDSGNCLPKHVTQELQQFLTCGILSHGFAQMYCDACRKRHLVAFSCKGRGFLPKLHGAADERWGGEPGGSCPARTDSHPAMGLDLAISFASPTGIRRPAFGSSVAAFQGTINILNGACEQGY